ncbi:MAG: hypothetical protein P8Y28_00580 [Gammaproteobacteria bacterium]
MNQKSQSSSIKILGGSIGNYPIKLELVPKRLSVSIYQQDLPGKGSHIPCWIFVSHGFAALKQRELVLILRINNTSQANKFPKTPLHLFMFLFKAVLQKKRFTIGDVVRFGDKGLMGFGGLGVTFSDVTLRQIQLPPHHLNCVLLTREEVEKVVLVVAAAMHGAIVNFIKQQGNNARFGFITQLLPYHEGALVWLPEKDSIEMNVHPDLDGNVIAGSYVALTQGEQSGAVMVEDGFQVELDNESWLALRNAIARKQNISITPSSGDMEFSLVWNTMTNPEKDSGLNLASTAGQGIEENYAESDGWMGRLKRLIKRE